MDNKKGFTAIELAAVTLLLMLLVLALLPAIAHHAMAANTTVVGVRGRDIFVSITGANTERVPLGLPPIWPSESLSNTGERSNKTDCFNFSNSTDYFRYLYDEQGIGSNEWRPLATGFNYSKLAGNGVSECLTDKLTAENNMWTIAMNVSDKTADIVPLLITRNVDASSLANKVSDADGWRPIRFDPEWKRPFGDWGFVTIRMGGAVFKARAKYAVYRMVYQNQFFDATAQSEGRQETLSLKYLTPTRKVTPSEQAYTDGAAREAQASRQVETLIRHEFAALPQVAFPLFVYLSIIYVAAVGACGVRPAIFDSMANFAHSLVYGVFHAAATVCCVCMLLGIAYRGGKQSGLLLALAVLSYSAGITFAAVWRYRDASTRQCALKFMVASPLLAMGSLVLLLVFSALARTEV